MKKILTFFALTSFAAAFSQITITANLPSNIGSGSSNDVDVKINKGAVGNFAKYQMDVPAGYVVSGVDVKGGNFTFENQRAKIVWVSVPGEAEFTVKFKLQVGSDAASPGTFAQKFYYLENNEKKEVEAAPIMVTVGGAGSTVAASTPAGTTTTPAVTQPVTYSTPTETKPVATSTPAETKPVESKPVESKPIAEAKPTNTSNKSTNSTEVAGTTFKIQLGAFTSEPSKSTFSGAGNVSIDVVNGLYKVTTGNFKTKEDAIKYRDQLQSKGFSGFIVKYENGRRIN